MEARLRKDAMELFSPLAPRDYSHPAREISLPTRLTNRWLREHRSRCSAPRIAFDYCNYQLEGDSVGRSVLEGDSE